MNQKICCGSLQKYGRGVTCGSRNDSRRAESPKYSPSMVTAPESWKLGTYCTTCRQLNRSDHALCRSEPLPGGLVLSLLVWEYLSAVPIAYTCSRIDASGNLFSFGDLLNLKKIHFLRFIFYFVYMSICLYVYMYADACVDQEYWSFLWSCPAPGTPKSLTK